LGATRLAPTAGRSNRVCHKAGSITKLSNRCATPSAMPRLRPHIPLAPGAVPASDSVLQVSLPAEPGKSPRRSVLPNGESWLDSRLARATFRYSNSAWTPGWSAATSGLARIQSWTSSGVGQISDEVDNAAKPLTVRPQNVAAAPEDFCRRRVTMLTARLGQIASIRCAAAGSRTTASANIDLGLSYFLAAQGICPEGPEHRPTLH